jgi:hypothetical protein
MTIGNMSWHNNYIVFWMVRILGIGLALLFMARLASAQSETKPLEKPKVEDQQEEVILNVEPAAAQPAQTGGGAFFAPAHPGNKESAKPSEAPTLPEEEGKKEDEDQPVIQPRNPD